MQKIQELQVYNRRCEHNPLVEHTFFMRIFCRTLVLCRRWRNFWLPFRKKLIINNRLCPCIFLAPATHGKATFASIVFSANTAMPIQIFPMKNATSYPCMLSSPIGIFYFLVCKRNFHPNAYFFFVSLVSSACCTILCPTHLSRSSTSNVWDQPLVLVAISSSATDTTVLLWARVPLDSKNKTDHLFLFTRMRQRSDIPNPTFFS